MVTTTKGRGTGCQTHQLTFFSTMSRQENLQEGDIRKWTGPQALDRGRSYSKDGAVQNLRWMGDTLKASCWGSRDNPYRVEITLSGEAIKKGFCSCPVGSEGSCKHVAAVLLTWLSKPGGVPTVQAFKKALGKLDKAELIGLIEQILERRPELESLVELALLTDKSEEELNEELIREQVSQALDDVGWDDRWRDIPSIASNLESVVQLADRYAGEGKSRLAAAVYRIACEETLETDWLHHDENGDLAEVIHDCTAGLQRCLEQEKNETFREEILAALFDTYSWDIQAGGLTIGDEIPSFVSEKATPREKARIAAWIQDVLPEEDSWKRQAYGGFLLALDESGDDERYLQICRETGRLEDLIEHLLQLGRVEEAASEAREAGDYDLLRAADLFVRYRRAKVAEELVRKRAETTEDSRLTAWLKERAKQRGDLKEALSLAEELFWKSPRTDFFQEIRKLAKPQGNWSKLRSEILTRLEQEKNYELLTRIYILEEDIDNALKAVKKGRENFGWYRRLELDRQIAEAAKKKRPEVTLRFYLEEVNRLIARRGRNNYREAVRYLKEIRKLFDRLEQRGRWEQTIAEFHSRHKNLPALQDELARVRL